MTLSRSDGISALVFTGITDSIVEPAESGNFDDEDVANAHEPEIPESKNIKILGIDGGYSNVLVTAYLAHSCCGVRRGIVVKRGPPRKKPSAKVSLYYLFAKHNRHRADLGKDELVWSPELADIAQSHCEDMVLHNFYSHDSYDGRTYADRMDDYSTTNGENLGEIEFSEGEKIPSYEQLDGMFDAWLDSAGHRANIESDEWDKIGIAAKYDPLSTSWKITVDFAFAIGGKAKEYMWSLEDYEAVRSMDMIEDDEEYVEVTAFVTDSLAPVAPASSEMKYKCMVDYVASDTINYDEKPSLVSHFACRTNACVNSYTTTYTNVEFPTAVETETYEGGNLTFDPIVWQHGQKYQHVRSQSFEACPYPNQTGFHVAFHADDCPDIEDAVQRCFSVQCRICQVESVVSDDSIRRDSGGPKVYFHGFDDAYEPNDYYDWQVGEYAVVFGVTRKLILPLDEGTSMEQFDEKYDGDDESDPPPIYVIPIKFGSFGPSGLSNARS